MSNSQKPSEVFSHWIQVIESTPGFFGQFDVRIKIHLEGEEGGVWLFDCSEDPPIRKLVGENSALVCDGELLLSVHSFASLIERRLNPQSAFLRGELKAVGNLAQVLRFSAVLDTLVCA